MNISLTVAALDYSFDTSIMNAIAAGITVVVGASNYNRDACIESPAHLGNPSGANAYSPNPNGYSTITVAATTQTDGRWIFGQFSSNFGPCVDIFAPGENITTVAPNSDTPLTLSGTSLAAPHVTGVVALHMERYSNPALPPASLEGVIKDNGTPNVLSSNPSAPDYIGAGSPNLLLFNSVLRRRACCSF